MDQNYCLLLSVLHMQYPSYFTEELVEEIANNPKGDHANRHAYNQSHPKQEQSF
jgi:hypothetical protein